MSAKADEAGLCGDIVRLPGRLAALSRISEFFTPDLRRPAQPPGPALDGPGPGRDQAGGPGILGVSAWVRRVILLPSQTSGSYLRPTTRS